ncbi:hypothetical protein Taro_045284 [Colocasia esculenta]|uniref:CCHC-type domain-containing protein n=1 Tax=Colocasia esculenta TaxID=4460 RepID=A0A843WWN4_COLES|nr:hypothetical protein [Colocasia esculenta]
MSDVHWISLKYNFRKFQNTLNPTLSKLQKILKKKKNISRRIQKKERKEKDPVCYECRKPGHLRPDCPKLKKTGQPEKSKKKHKKFKRKAMAAAWENEEATSSESSSSELEKEQDSLGASGSRMLKALKILVNCIITKKGEIV